MPFDSNCSRRASTVAFSWAAGGKLPGAIAKPRRYPALLSTWLPHSRHQAACSFSTCGSTSTFAGPSSLPFGGVGAISPLRAADRGVRHLGGVGGPFLVAEEPGLSILVLALGVVPAAQVVARLVGQVEPADQLPTSRCRRGGSAAAA